MIMRKHVVISFLLMVGLLLTACGNNSVQTIDSEIAENNTSNETTESHPLVVKLDRVQELGTALFDEFNGFDNMDYKEKSSAIKKAESYTALMNDEYQGIIEYCNENASYADISYQTQLLAHLIPMPITDDKQSIDNAEVLYQMYFQQLSSSFSYFAEDTEHINNNEPLTKRTAFFECVPQIAKPDTIIYGISAFDEQTEDGVIKYTYKSGENAADAQMNYNLYLIALGMDTGLTLQFDGAAAYVYDGNNMVSAIMAGEDEQIGNFFMISFPEK